MTKRIIGILSFLCLILLANGNVFAQETKEKQSGNLYYIDTTYRDDEGNRCNGVVITKYRNSNLEEDGILEKTETDGKVVITFPSIIDGKKVIQIGYGDGLSGSEEVIDDGYNYELSKRLWDEVEVVIPEGIEAIGYNAFYQRYSLKKVTLPKSLKWIGDSAFSECKYLKEVVMQEGLEEIGSNCFDQCYDLQSIDIPATVSRIEEYAFSDCRSMKSYNVAKGNKDYISKQGMLCKVRNETEYDPDTDTTQEYTVTYVLYYPSGKSGTLYLDKDMEIDDLAVMNALELKEITVNSDNPWYSSDDGILYSKDMTQLYACPCKKTGRYVIPDTVTSIFYSAFSNSSLSKIVIPDSVKYIDRYVFYQCGSLETILVGKNANRLDFTSCPKLSTIQISEENSHYTVIDNVVYDKELTYLLFCPRTYTGRLVIPDTVERESYDAFESSDLDSGTYRCNGISEIYYGAAYRIEGLGDEDDEYEYEEDDEEDDGEGDDEEDEYDEYDIYSGPKLEKYEVSPNNTQLMSIDGILYTKNGKALLKIPTVRKDMVTIPDGVTSLEYDSCTGNDGKYNNSCTAPITIPASVTDMSYCGYSGGTIYGYTGSVAEKYAKEHQCTFVSIGQVETPQPTPGAPSTPTQQPSTGQPATPQVNNPAGVNVNSISLAKVSRLKVKAKGSRKITISWAGVSNARNYQVQISMKKNFKKGSKVRISPKTKFTWKKLKKGKTYYVRVRACANGRYGAWSKAKKVKVK